ncbi:hypothetical protein THIOM_002521 [Candidatus Thiomargarita nelsonii]|uniref:Uncharacterized protein n=1 Tax=Candidatus Thiomargarita nelsonii TaxID=1003181 RepID=A0A176S141_9GAMM|nr:hypothetical protein THIOM_002521 [Candidatus Thiomargarita nelsonii]
MAFKHDGNDIGGAFHLCLKQLMNTSILRILSLSIIPLNQQLVLLHFSQERQFR